MVIGYKLGCVISIIAGVEAEFSLGLPSLIICFLGFPSLRIVVN
jgi:hypothetical protein